MLLQGCHTRNFYILLVSALLAVSILSAIQSEAQPTATLYPSTNQIDLQADARLQQAISLDKTGIPLEELLTQLTSKGLFLTCTRSCAQMKLQIHLKQRPLYVLMRSLAQLVPGEWKAQKDKSGYTLSMSEAAVIRRDRWWEMFLREREEALASQRSYVLQQLRKTPYVRKPEDPNPENSQPEAEAAIAAQQEFFNNLPASIQEQIAKQMSVNALYRSGTLWMGNFNPEGCVSVAVSDLPAKSQALVRKSVPNLSDKDAAVDIKNGAYCVWATLLQSNGIRVAVNARLSFDFAPDTLTLSLDQTRLAQKVDSMGRTSPESWKRLAAYQKSVIWKNDPPAVKSMRSPPPQRSGVLQWLGDKADLEFVADYYSQVCDPFPPEARSQPLSRPLKEELDYRASEHDMSWKKQTNGIYLFRNNRWYRDDLLEVSDADLKRLLKSQNSSVFKGARREDTIAPEAQAKAQLELEAEIVSTLTPWQIANGLTFFVQEKDSRNFDPDHPAYAWRPLAYMTERVLSDYNTIVLYAGLLPSSRDALIHGQLPFALLSPSQQQQALFILPGLKARLNQNSQSPLLKINAQRPTAFGFLGYNGGPDMKIPFDISLVLNNLDN